MKKKDLEPPPRNPSPESQTRALRLGELHSAAQIADLHLTRFGARGGLRGGCATCSSSLSWVPVIVGVWYGGGGGGYPFLAAGYGALLFFWGGGEAKRKTKPTIWGSKSLV